MKRVYVVICLILTGFLVGCTPQVNAGSSTKSKENKESTMNTERHEGATMTAETMGHQAGEAAQAVKEYSSEKMHEAIRSAESGLQKSKEEITHLKKKMSGLSESTQKQYHHMMENLDDKIEEAESQLHDLKNASGGAWEAAKDNLKHSMKSLKKASEEAGKVFKKAMSQKSNQQSQQQKQPQQ